MFENSHINITEYQYILNILEQKIYLTKNILLKKMLAECEISINKSAGEIFVFYVDYLLDEQSHPQISTAFYHSIMCTEQIEHLPKIEQIFDYIKDKELGWENQFCYYLNNIVMNSYRAISKKVNTTDFERIVSSIKKCAESVPYYESLLEKISNEFSKRNYVPLTLEQVKLLK